MNVFLRGILLLLLVAGLADCKSKKKSLSGEDPVEIGDFIDFFPESKLPWQFADTSLARREKDSLLINYKVFSQFVPDSILGKLFGKNAKPRIYPMGRVRAGDETYLFAKAIQGEKRSAVVLGFDKKDEFIAAMPLLQTDNSAATQQVAGIDSRYTLSKTILRKNADGTVSEGKDVYVLNKDARNFMLILTDALDEKATELINPIDTFSRKQKFSADYGSGTMTLFSFRDGRKSDRLTFFIHFEKNGGECIGELKGEAIIKSATQAEYREPGEPCSLQFTFTANAVRVKELSGCGSRRGLRCSFEGTYPRKKEAKPKTEKTKKSSGK
jgi:hypothetical protein